MFNFNRMSTKGRIAAAASATMIAIATSTLTSTPAFADLKSCTTMPAYEICDYDQGVPGQSMSMQGSVQVTDGSYASKISNCTVSTWAAMRNSGATWYTPTFSTNCFDAFRSNLGFPVPYNHYASGTGATQIDSKTCAYLYVSGNPSPASTVCAERTWHTLATS